jgi:hypothetical protein
MRDIMETLAQRLAPALPGAALSDVFDLLIWTVDDNGADIVRVLREWVSSDDVVKVDAALSVKELFLFDSREKMVANLVPVKERFPELAPKVDQVLGRWDASRPAED